MNFLDAVAYPARTLEKLFRLLRNAARQRTAGYPTKHQNLPSETLWGIAVLWLGPLASRIGSGPASTVPTLQPLLVQKAEQVTEGLSTHQV